MDGKIQRWRVGGLGIGNCVGHVVAGASLIFCGDFSMVAASSLSTRKHSLVFTTTLLRTNVFGTVAWLRRVLRPYIHHDPYAQHDTHFHQVSFHFTLTLPTPHIMMKQHFLLYFLVPLMSEGVFSDTSSMI